MIKSFQANVAGTDFEFNTMNVNRLHLYQVYVMDQGQKKRFHMQADASGIFNITDPMACPEEILPLEFALNEAIYLNNDRPVPVI